MTAVASGGRRPLFLGLIALLTFAGGWLAQDWSQLGAGSPDAELTAVATDVVGGAGQRQPVQVQLSVLVNNAGTEEIRVNRPSATGNGTSILQFDPAALVVHGGQNGQLIAEVALDCAVPSRLTLPALEVNLIDGGHRTLPVDDSGLLLDACSRGRPGLRPLAVSVLPVSGRQFRVRLSSPTGRPTRITAIRAGGVDLIATPVPVTVTGQSGVEVELTPPSSCPPQWPGSGLPSALSFDLSPDPGADPGTDPGTIRASASAPVTILRLFIGPPLTSWLLATSCAGGVG